MAFSYPSCQNHKCQESWLPCGLQRRVSSHGQRLFCSPLPSLIPSCLFCPIYSNARLISSLPQIVLLHFLYLPTYGLCFSGFLTPLQTHCSGCGLVSPPICLFFLVFYYIHLGDLCTMYLSSFPASCRSQHFPLHLHISLLVPSLLSHSSNTDSCGPVFDYFICRMHNEQLALLPSVLGYTGF